MRASRRIAAVIVGLSAAIFTTGPTDAADESAHLREMLRRTTGEMREMEDANASLKAKQAEYERKIAELTAQLAARQKEGEEMQNRLDSLGEANRRARVLESQVQQDQAALTKWNDAYKALVDVAKKEKEEHEKFKNLYTKADDSLKTCSQKNAALYEVGIDMVHYIEDKNLFQKLTEEEPFTQLSRVKLENLAQDYEDKLVDQRVTDNARK